MAAILSPHGLYGGNRKSKIPLLNNQGYKPTKGTLGICLHSTIGRMPSDYTSRSLNSSLAIPMHALRFEASSALQPQTGQAGFSQTATPCLRLGFVAQPSNPVIFW
jgi:hypothetical protein